MNQRLHKVNENLQRELSLILHEEPVAENTLFTVSYVTVSADLRHASVWISVLDKSKEAEIIALLNERSSSFFQPLSDRLKMKHIPLLTFKPDDQTEQINRIDSILDNLNQPES